jgi:hypothetical protein
MKSIESIAVLIPPQLKRKPLEKLIENSIALAIWLKGELHILCSSDQEEIINTLLSKFNWKLSVLIVHKTIPDNIEHIIESILSALNKYSCDLILLEYTNTLINKKIIDLLLQACQIPIMVIPKKYNFKSQLPSTFLVPLSGEQSISESLALALKLGLQTNSFVDIVHVINKGKLCLHSPTFESLGGEVHHEYDALKDKVACEACPYSSPEERERIRHFYQLHGITIVEIFKLINLSPPIIIVIEWKGLLVKGKANIVKTFLLNAFFPILFTRLVPE